MCGICGIVDFSGAPIDAVALDAMRDEMRSRGPDDSGSRIVAGAGLGHRRLSIIDLSPRGRQPMSSADGRAMIVFNGEIYNFLELRSALEREALHVRQRHRSADRGISGVGPGVAAGSN
jgi:asparagine synthase (glutamine-hydrolysing)